MLFTVVNALRGVARMVPVLAESSEAGAALTAMGSRRSLRDVLVEYTAQQACVAVDLMPLIR